MSDFQSNSTVRKRKDGVEYQEFYPGRSKAILDEIDLMLAEHYGFTRAELDFVQNYDIKYRLGQDADPEG